MTSIVTPSVAKTTTAGQIDKAVASYRALLEKHGPEFDSEIVQLVLGQPETAQAMFTAFRARVEVQSNLFVRRVTVNRNRTPIEMIEATGRVQYIDRKVVDTMPQGEGEEVEVVFFNLGRDISDNDLEKEYKLRGLKAADPYSLAAINEADPTFADQRPNATHWKNSNGKWCYADFPQWIDNERSVSVFRSDNHWYSYWWFAGVRN